VLNQRFEYKQILVGYGRYVTFAIYHTKMSLVAYDSSDTDESEKEEDSAPLKSKISILSAPRNIHRVGPVKIGLPALVSAGIVDIPC